MEGENTQKIAYVAISEEQMAEMQKLKWLSGPDWQKAKGHWITIRQMTKHGPMFRSLFAQEDYIHFVEYESSSLHSFIILD